VITQPLICVEASRSGLQAGAEGEVDVFAALGRQFFWADRVMLDAEDADGVLSGEVVAGPAGVHRIDTKG
jgi:hypothetical protein